MTDGVRSSETEVSHYPDDDRRFEYTMVGYGVETLPWDDHEHDTLEDAIEDYAADGWRFVQAIDQVAIFEREVPE